LDRPGEGSVVQGLHLRRQALVDRTEFAEEISE
jgi:hypothetical protein